MKRQAVSDRAREILRQDDECVLNMRQMEEWSKTKEQKLEEMLAQTTKHVLLYCFNIDKERMK